MRALRNAALLAVGYLVIAGTWIAVSDQLVAAAAGSVREAARWGAYKGLVFVAVTGVLLFLGAWGLLRDAERRQAELARRREHMFRLERKALLGAFCGSLAHEFRNLLTVVASTVDALRREDGAASGTRALLDDLERSLDRGLALTREMADADAGSLDAERVVDLRDLARSALDSVSWHLMVKRTRHGLEAGPPVPARVRPAVLQHALAHLVLSAGEHTDGRGRIELRLARSDHQAVLEVHDDGGTGGLAPNGEAALSEGLGLALAEQAAAAHSGRLEVTPSDLGGVCVRFRLPVGRGTRYDRPPGDEASD